MSEDQVVETRHAPKVVVVGAGTMGAGVAQSFLVAGAEVNLVDRQVEVTERAALQIRGGLERHWRDETASEPLIASALERLTTAIDVDRASDVDLVIEAVPEQLELKRAVLRHVDERCPGAVIATNTSSLPITELASVVSDPCRFVGMHFFNPVPRSELVEVVVSPDTSAETISQVQHWAAQLEKTTILVQDSPGFATSRLGLALGLEAIRMVEQSVASPEDIDLGMTLGYKHPIGPLRLTDLVGLDVRLSIAEYLASTLGPRFEPPQLLRDMVAAGTLGKKSGEGFYRWG